MLIRTIWCTDDRSWEKAWLMDAWDEYTIDENPDEWHAALDKASKHGDYRVIDLRVSDGDLAAHFEACAEEPADVVPPRREGILLTARSAVMVRDDEEEAAGGA